MFGRRRILPRTFSDPLAPAAPVMTWDTDGTDNTPTFTADFDDTLIASGDIIHLQWSTDPSFNSPSVDTDTLDAGEILAGEVAFTTGALADGVWYARCRHQHVAGGVNHFSPWSNTVSETIATSLPGPDTITGLWSWIKADAGVYQDSSLTTPVTADADPIGGMQDQSGNTRHWTQATSGLRPTYKTGIVNSLPVMRAPGGGDGPHLEGPDMSSLTSGEIFIVLKAATDPQDTSDSYLWRMGTPTNDVHYIAFGAIYDSFGSDTRYNTGDPTEATDAFHLYNVSSETNDWTSRINGTQHYNTGTNTVAFSSAPRIFSSYTLASGSWEGDIAEMIIYDNVLSAGDRDTVEAYIADKYGITI